LRLLSQSQRERSALQVDLGRTVLIAHPQCQRQIAPDFPLVLQEARNIVRADVARRSSELQILVRQAHQEVRPVVLREAAAARTVEEELAVHVEVVSCVVLVGRIAEAAFDIMLALGPSDGVTPSSLDPADRPK
jgi:hypothetical protein